MTEQNGQVSRCDYLPFGSEIPSGYAGRTSPWGSNDSLAQKFTSQERDTETGLDFFQARYLGSAQGRFLGADPENTAANVSNPQTWNAYSYVLNDPVYWIDPSGLEPCDAGDDSCDWGFDIGLGLWPPWWSSSGSNPSSLPVPMQSAQIQANTTGVYGSTNGIYGANGFLDPALAGGGSLGVAGGGALWTVGEWSLGAICVATGACEAAAIVAGVTAVGVAGGYLIYRGVRQLGGSGNPRRHFPRYPSRKRALDAARDAGQGPPEEHRNPKEGRPHFHPTDANGNIIPDGVHHTFPR